MDTAASDSRMLIDSDSLPSVMSFPLRVDANRLGVNIQLNGKIKLIKTL